MDDMNPASDDIASFAEDFSGTSPNKQTVQVGEFDPFHSGQDPREVPSHDHVNGHAQPDLLDFDPCSKNPFNGGGSDHQGDNGAYNMEGYQQGGFEDGQNSPNSPGAVNYGMDPVSHDVGAVNRGEDEIMARSFHENYNNPFEGGRADEQPDLMTQSMHEDVDDLGLKAGTPASGGDILDLSGSAPQDNLSPGAENETGQDNVAYRDSPDEYPGNPDQYPESPDELEQPELLQQLEEHVMLEERGLPDVVVPAFDHVEPSDHQQSPTEGFEAETPEFPGPEGLIAVCPPDEAVEVGGEPEVGGYVEPLDDLKESAEVKLPEEHAEEYGDEHKPFTEDYEQQQVAEAGLEMQSPEVEQRPDEQLMEPADAMEQPTQEATLQSQYSTHQDETFHHEEPAQQFMGSPAAAEVSQEPQFIVSAGTEDSYQPQVISPPAVAEDSHQTEFPESPAMEDGHEPGFLGTAAAEDSHQPEFPDSPAAEESREPEFPDSPAPEESREPELLGSPAVEDRHELEVPQAENPHEHSSDMEEHFGDQYGQIVSPDHAKPFDSYTYNEPESFNQSKAPTEPEAAEEPPAMVSSPVERSPGPEESFAGFNQEQAHQFNQERGNAAEESSLAAYASTINDYLPQAEQPVEAQEPDHPAEPVDVRPQNDAVMWAEPRNLEESLQDIGSSVVEKDTLELTKEETSLSVTSADVGSEQVVSPARELEEESKENQLPEVDQVQPVTAAADPPAQPMVPLAESLPAVAEVAVAPPSDVKSNKDIPKSSAKSVALKKTPVSSVKVKKDSKESETKARLSPRKVPELQKKETSSGVTQKTTRTVTTSRPSTAASERLAARKKAPETTSQTKTTTTTTTTTTRRVPTARSGPTSTRPATSRPVPSTAPARSAPIAPRKIDTKSPTASTTVKSPPAPARPLTTTRTRVAASRDVNKPSLTPSASGTSPRAPTSPRKVAAARRPLGSTEKDKTSETTTTRSPTKAPLSRLNKSQKPSTGASGAGATSSTSSTATKTQNGPKPKVQSKIGSMDNSTHRAGGGEKKIEKTKLEWKATSKVGSMDNAKHRPTGGEKKIEKQKVDFKNKAQSRVGSMENAKHKAGGGDKKEQPKKSPIETKKLDFKEKAQAKTDHGATKSDSNTEEAPQEATPSEPPAAPEAADTTGGATEQPATQA